MGPIVGAGLSRRRSRRRSRDELAAAAATAAAVEAGGDASNPSTRVKTQRRLDEELIAEHMKAEKRRASLPVQALRAPGEANARRVLRPRTVKRPQLSKESS